MLYINKSLVICFVIVCVSASLDIRHHNYDDMVEYLKSIREKCQDITRLYTIGKTVENREMWVLEMTKNPGEDAPLKPNFKYIGNMHGNEVVGREVLLYLLDDMCEKYKKGDPETVALVDNTRMHIMPSMNPDGYERGVEGDCTSVRGRPNANGKDLNRNFPDQFVQTRDNAVPQVETLNVEKWLQEYNFVLSANLHGGSLVANYPYDDDKEMKEKDSPSPDDDVFRSLALSYSKNHPRMHLGRPCPDTDEYFKDGITNGAMWYNVAGGMQDYNYLHSNAFEITVELACCKFPRAERLPTLWDEHKKSLVAFMKQVHKGIKGNIRYSNGTGIPDAVVQIANADDHRFRKHDIRSGDNGDYFRLLLPGNYIVKVIADNQELEAAVEVKENSPGTVYNFVVSDGAISAVHTELMQREENHMSFFEDVAAKSKKTRHTDNLMAAGVIITIGCIVCILAGIVLYRKVKELRSVETGGYAKLDPEKCTEDEP